MEELTKSEIVRKVSWAFDHSENLKLEAVLKTCKSTIVKLDLIFSEREHFIDKNGVKWIRDS